MRLLLGKIKLFICDVIPDYHLITGRWNMNINPQERMFPPKWSESSVMSYVYITDDKGETFNPVGGVVTYFMEVLTKRDCW